CPGDWHPLGRGLGKGSWTSLLRHAALTAFVIATPLGCMPAGDGGGSGGAASGGVGSGGVSSGGGVGTGGVGTGGLGSGGLSTGGDRSGSGGLSTGGSAGGVASGGASSGGAASGGAGSGGGGSGGEGSGGAGGPDPNFHLFLLSGQSNMAGAPAPENSDKTENPNILVLGYNNCQNLGRTYNEWDVASPPLHDCYGGV